MAGIEERLAQIGLALPALTIPSATYVPFARSGNQVIISGQLCLDWHGSLVARGLIGDGIDAATGRQAAEACALNVLSALKAAAGDLNRVTRVLRLGGFMTVAPGFTDISGVMDGASDLMMALFGDRGAHARTTVGVAALPMGASIEIDGLFEIT